MTIKLPIRGANLLFLIFISLYGNGFARNEIDLIVSFDISQTSSSNYSIHTNTLSGCAPLIVYFSSTDSCKNCDYRWTFEDGQVSDLKYPFYTYTEPGIYFPSLRIIDSEGHVHESEIKITVYPIPIPKFKINPTEIFILNPKVQFINESSITDNGSLIWKWDFGDDSYSYNYEPIHAYDKIGSYKVSLLVSSAYGCSSQNSMTLKVQEHFRAHFPTAFTPGHYPVNNYFYPKGTGAIRDYFLMEIYNSWGELIFVTETFPEGFFVQEPIEGGWDGRSKNTGEYVESGTYIYRVRIIDSNKDKHMYEGSITLIR